VAARRRLEVPAQARSADNGARRQLVDTGEATGDEGVAGILARRDRRQHEALGHLHRHVLQRVNREIGVSVLHGDLELLDEQALAADRRQRPIEDLVTARAHAKDIDRHLWI